MSTADFIISDLHLGAVAPETERAFAAFLRARAPEMRSLLIAGDLFDFWFEWGGVTIGAHFRCLAALADLVEAGVPVTLIGGNHDAWGGSFLQDEVGIRVLEGPVRMRLGGRDALVAHGDGVGQGDLRYRALKSVIRSRAATGAFRMLHPEIGLRIARAVSTTTHKAAGDGASSGRAGYIRDWAVARLKEDRSLGMVVCGHTHAAEIREPCEGRYYLNAGDWLHHYSYAVVADGEPPRLLTWSPQAATP